MRLARTANCWLLWKWYAANGATALAKIRAGAGAVQLYSALAYSGPSLVARIAADLSDRLEAEGFKTVSAAVGAGR